MRWALWAAGLLAAAPAVAQEVIAEASFPEGPVFVDGTLLWAEYAGNVVRSWDGTAVATLWAREGCGPSAVAPLGEDLLVTCYDDGTFARITLGGEDVATYSADSTGAPFQGPNDLAPDGAGGLWATASGPWESGPIVGRLYHVAPDGTVALAADDLHYANGVARSADGARLYVNESEAGRVISFAVGPDLTLSDRRLAVRVGVADPDSGIGAYPDGIKVDAEGNLWIGQYSSGRIVVTTPEGELVRVIDTGATAAPNFAFTPDGGDLYVMAVDQTDGPPYAGRVLRIPLDQ